MGTLMFVVKNDKIVSDNKAYSLIAKTRFNYIAGNLKFDSTTSMLHRTLACDITDKQII